MAYQALYRTYRPRDFEEVAGQDHITRTFKNALMNNKLAHAYLFSGPRGTGKTSIAKIIAKAVNCKLAPVANPCNQCDVCEGIDKNQIHDVIEIDAASNNGVDEIREIRDKVKYLPSVGQYKVYIIDEVHMLSTGAFNALLKTLEEPPKHVIFILATTEPHKIPATIHSRCQRFDFRGIALPDMMRKLKAIIDHEKIAIDEAAVRLIAESAEGGMRDAISLLDQVVSYSEETVTIDHVHAIRGSIAEDDLLGIGEAIERHEVVEAFNLFERLLTAGKEPRRLLEDFIRFFRDVLMYKNTEDAVDERLLSVSERFKRYSESLGNARIFHYIDILHDIQQKMRFGGQAQLYMELAFVKMVDTDLKQEAATLDKMADFEERIDAMQSQLDALQSGADDQPVTGDTPYRAERPVADVSSESEPTHAEQEEVAQVESNEKETPKTDTDSAPAEKEEAANPPQPTSTDPFAKLYEKYRDKPYKTFDIHFVEDVLHTGDREVKIDMTKKWFDIERTVSTEDMTYARMITEGNLVATNGPMIIITYDSYPMCNKVMSKDVHHRLVELLEDYFKRPIMMQALPEELWELISGEFVKKFRAKTDPDAFIKLTPINHPKLIDIPAEETTFDDVRSDSFKEARDLFGDIVKVKKGD
ncbi:MAG: DNA polymerase III subunit gamma/tau [Acholeplasmatales bacterium]|nr:MAG: DNA polymerase III subunit gamma/tau [Acholeplasmatales bacterium]